MKYLRDEDGIKAFGNRIKQLRLEKGFSQESLAYSSGLTLSQVARIERGEINTSLSTVFVMARTMNIELKELFDFYLPKFEREI